MSPEHNPGCYQEIPTTPRLLVPRQCPIGCTVSKTQDSQKHHFLGAERQRMPSTLQKHEMPPEPPNCVRTAQAIRPRTNPQCPSLAVPKPGRVHDAIKEKWRDTKHQDTSRPMHRPLETQLPPQTAKSIPSSAMKKTKKKDMVNTKINKQKHSY